MFGAPALASGTILTMAQPLRDPEASPPQARKPRNGAAQSSAKAAAGRQAAATKATRVSATKRKQKAVAKLAPDVGIVVPGGEAVIGVDRGREALTRIMGSFVHDRDGYVTLLLEAVADQAESRTAPVDMPEAERAAWEAAGASFEDPGAVARVHARAAAAFAGLLTRSVPGDAAVAELLGVDRSRVSQRLTERSLYSFHHGDDRYYPRWQFQGTMVMRGMRDVLRALDESLHPLTVDHWFTTPSRELLVDGEPVAPAAWLAIGGKVDAVSAVAADL